MSRFSHTFKHNPTKSSTRSKKRIMSSISRWFCSNGSENLFVKIVHPGEPVELHDRPILAAELLNRNPKCCVAHPTVFRQPDSIVSPETTLALGEKYYVVPLGTIRKLQLKYPRPLKRDHASTQQDDRLQNIGEIKDDGSDSSSVCWLFRSNKNDEKEKDGNNGCLQSMSSVIKMKPSISESSGEGKRTESRWKRANGDSSVGVGNGEGSASPGRLSLVSFDNWQPCLESVVEE